MSISSLSSSFLLSIKDYTTKGMQNFTPNLEFSNISFTSEKSQKIAKFVLLGVGALALGALGYQYTSQQPEVPSNPNDLDKSAQKNWRNQLTKLDAKDVLFYKKLSKSLTTNFLNELITIAMPKASKELIGYILSSPTLNSASRKSAEEIENTMGVARESCRKDLAEMILSHPASQMLLFQHESEWDCTPSSPAFDIAPSSSNELDEDGDVIEL